MDKFQEASKFFSRKLTGNDLVKGGGTGVSDSVPAVITSREGTPQAPAALSVGEFVVKANTVSHLGGGATDPGVEFLTLFTEIVDEMDRYTATTYAEIILMLGKQLLSDTTPEMEEMEDDTNSE